MEEGLGEELGFYSQSTSQFRADVALEWSDFRVVRDWIILNNCAGCELADAMEVAKYSLFAVFIAIS